MTFIFFTLLFLGLIIAWLGFGERGFKYLYGKEKERQAYLKRIHKLEKENQELLEDDEILYRFIREKEESHSADAVKKKNQ
ncbi:MAG: hypothetical protein JRJ02_09000 [Deltaproteobacteria bacterium]|nr:hypothetical protein [Deltaproteobacteria bacterium]